MTELDLTTIRTKVEEYDQIKQRLAEREDAYNQQVETAKEQFEAETASDRQQKLTLELEFSQLQEAGLTVMGYEPEKRTRRKRADFGVPRGPRRKVEPGNSEGQPQDFVA